MRDAGRHAVEIALVFNVKTLWDAGSHEEGSARAMGSRWARFAIHGNPGPSSLLFLPCDHADTVVVVDPEWKEFSRENPSWMAFGEGGGCENEDLTGWEVGRVAWNRR
jgi:carboxylesterase type B